MMRNLITNLMKRLTVRSRLVAIAASLLMSAVLIAPVSAMAHVNVAPATYSGTLYYTTRQNNGTCTTNCTPNVFKVTYTYNRLTPLFTLGTSTKLATTKGADGIVVDPVSRNLLVGGQSTGNVYEVSPSGGGVLKTVASSVYGAYHLTLGNEGSTVWVFAETNSTPQGVGMVPLSPLGNGTAYKVTGSDTKITQFAFDPITDTYYYTYSSWSGGGDYGTLTINTFYRTITTTKLGHIAAAHGIVYDPYSHDIFMSGANEIAQLDPSTNTIVSTYTSSLTTGKSTGQNHFDQVTVDGMGHLFATWNGGNLLFIDYSHTGLVGSNTDYVASPFLTTNLDDVVNQLPEVPFAAALPLMLIPALVWFRRRKTRTN